MSEAAPAPEPVERPDRRPGPRHAEGGPTGTGPTRPQLGLLGLQRLAGNAAVVRQRQAGRAPVQRAPEVQRELGNWVGLHGHFKNSFTLPDSATFAAADATIPFTPSAITVGVEGDIGPSADKALDVKGAGGLGEPPAVEVEKKFMDIAISDQGKGNILNSDGWKLSAKGVAQAGVEKTDLGVTLEIGTPIGPLEVTPRVFALKYDKETIAKNGAPSFEIATAEVKQSLKYTKEFTVGQTKLKFEGTVFVSTTFKPNWKAILRELGIDLLPLAAEAAVVLGPPLVFAGIAALAIIDAGEWGDYRASILTGAMDARRAAVIHYLLAAGVASPPAPKGPISSAMLESVTAFNAQQAALAGMPVETFKARLSELNGQGATAQVAWAQARGQMLSAYDRKVGDSLSVWRANHKFHSFWTMFSTDRGVIDRDWTPLLKAELTSADISGAPRE